MPTTLQQQAMTVVICVTTDLIKPWKFAVALLIRVFDLVLDTCGVGNDK